MKMLNGSLRSYFIFATNLGGTAYAFNKIDSSIVQFEFMGMLIDDDLFFVVQLLQNSLAIYTSSTFCSNPQTLITILG